MKKNIIVIYHRADFDGEFSREIARLHFGDTADYIGWDYGDPVPEIPADTEWLYMIDISVSGLMGHPKLIWIDHHKSAMEEFPAWIRGYRIDGVAACRLAWQWFAAVEFVGVEGAQASIRGPVGDWDLPDKRQFVERIVTEPLGVRLAGEYDVWDKRDPRADLFQHGLRSQPIEWRRLLSSHRDGKLGDDERYVEQLLEAGKYLAYSAQQSNARTIREVGFDVQWEGLTWLAANIRGGSLSFTAGIQPRHDGLMGFRWVGNQWKVSLYGVPGKPDIDLAAIAVRHGGGGHKQACGFECAVLPFSLGARLELSSDEARALVDILFNDFPMQAERRIAAQDLALALATKLRPLLAAAVRDNVSDAIAFGKGL